MYLLPFWHLKTFLFNNEDNTHQISVKVNEKCLRNIKFSSQVNSKLVSLEYSCDVSDVTSFSSETHNIGNQGKWRGLFISGHGLSMAKCPNLLKTTLVPGWCQLVQAILHPELRHQELTLLPLSVVMVTTQTLGAYSTWKMPDSGSLWPYKKNKTKTRLIFSLHY